MTTELPRFAGAFARENPEVWTAYAALGQACAEAGPLGPEMRRLVKLALAVGLGSEGAVHSHARQALAEGADPASLRHIGLLAITTLGFPSAAAGLSWIEDVIAGKER